MTESSAGLGDTPAGTMGPVISSSSSPDLSGRDPGVRSLVKFFDFEHLPDDLRLVSERFAHLAYDMVNELPDSAELTFSLRQLLLSKDAAVRCRVEARRPEDSLEVRRCPVGGTHVGHKWHEGNQFGSLFQDPRGAQELWCRGEPK